MTIPAVVWKEHSKELLDAANRYGVSGLKLEAEAWYIRNTTITDANAVDILLYADSKSCANLKEKVMDYFVESGKDAIPLVTTMPESFSAFADLLQAISLNREDAEFREPQNYNGRRIDSLRRELEGRLLDVDGSRETLIKRLEEDDKGDAEKGKGTNAANEAETNADGMGEAGLEEANIDDGSLLDEMVSDEGED